MLTAISAAGGAVSYLLGGSAINDLKVPADHTTPSQTHDLVIRARVGQVTSYVLFPVTGLTTLWSTISTVKGVIKVAKFLKTQIPPVAPAAGALPGGMVAGFRGSF